MIALLVLACGPGQAPTGAPPAPTSSPASRTPPPPRPNPAPSATPSISSAPRPAPLPPLEGEAWLDLPLSWGEPALVSVPLGARRPQPLLVAAHGAGGRAEYHCKLWRRIVGEEGFVICPRGYPMNRLDPQTGYFYDGHPALGREIEAALQALARRFGPHVDAADPIFVGYSQGASMGALVLPHHPARFARAVLWEGGVGQYQEWNVAMAQRFRDRGGARVLMACGRPKCHTPAQKSASYFRRAEIDTRLIYVAGAGHTAGGALAEAVAEAFSWLVEGDRRWSIAGEPE